MFQLPTSLPAARPQPAAAAAAASTNSPATVIPPQRAIEVAQGADTSQAHTGDFIATKNGPVYVEDTVDGKVTHWNRAFSRGPDYIVTGTGDVHDLKSLGFQCNDNMLRALQNAHLNRGCGWSIPHTNPLPKNPNAAVKRVISTQEGSSSM